MGLLLVTLRELRMFKFLLAGIICITTDKIVRSLQTTSYIYNVMDQLEARVLNMYTIQLYS